MIRQRSTPDGSSPVRRIAFMEPFGASMRSLSSMSALAFIRAVRVAILGA
ncbi:hypothetical protein OHR68_29270 [Spirillospora sp. NBC_00431]